MAEPDRSTTGRGFTVYDRFTDTHGSEITVQESSAAAGPCCWIFARADSGVSGAAPHLNVEQARRVRDALGAFIGEHGDGDDLPPR